MKRAEHSKKCDFGNRSGGDHVGPSAVTAIRVRHVSQSSMTTTRAINGRTLRLTAVQPKAWKMAPAENEDTVTVENTRKSFSP